jgi:KUP system potassium uptake protein
MYVWYNARKITLRLLTYENLKDFLPALENLINDKSVPKYATHVVYLTKMQSHKLIEKRIVESIFSNPAKRADVYWFINFHRADDPYVMEYEVEEIVEHKVIRVDFHLGFRIQPRIGIMLKRVVEEMVKNKEIDIHTPFTTIHKEGLKDFRFIILERFLSYDNEFSAREGFILNAYFAILKTARSDSEAYGIDINQAVFEKVPLVVAPVSNINLKRTSYKIAGKENYE